MGVVVVPSLLFGWTKDVFGSRSSMICLFFRSFLSAEMALHGVFSV